MFNVKHWLLGIGFWLLVPVSVLAEQILVYSSWNLEWLSSNPSRKFPSSQRTNGDYQALSRHFNQLDSDVLAFQEVNDLVALRKVVGNDYQLYLSQRSEPRYQMLQFTDINQYTGFAVRNGISVENKTDVRLDVHSNSKLRFATYVVINPASDGAIHLLSVHLKARCSGAYKNNAACRTLNSQAKALNQWIVQREANQQAYMIIGDFNHNLSYPNDWLWQTLSTNSQAKLATRNTSAECKVRSRKQPNKTHQFRSLIDHAVISHDLALKSVKQITYELDDLFQYQLSDHCPLRLQ